MQISLVSPCLFFTESVESLRVTLPRERRKYASKVEKGSIVIVIDTIDIYITDNTFDYLLGKRTSKFSLGT